MSVLLETNAKRPSERYRSGGWVGYIFVEPLRAVFDIAIIVISALVGGVGYHLVVVGAVGDVGSFIGLGLTTGIIYVLSVYHKGLYNVREIFRGRFDLKIILTNWIFAILILGIVLFVLKIGGSISRGAVLCLAVTGGTALVIWGRISRKFLKNAFAVGIISGRRAIVLGSVSELAYLKKADLLAKYGVDEVERISLPHERGKRTEAILPILRLAVQRARDGIAEQVLVAIPWADTTQLEFVRNELRSSPLSVCLLPDRAASRILAYDTRASVLPLSIEIQRAPLSLSERLTKRFFDLVIAVPVLLLLTPLMILIALAIKLDSRGPIFFKQRRKGFNGREFGIYKFRTMTVLEDGQCIRQATKNDDRVTRLGRILRQTSADELPQLLNVVIGEMSLVGPRPHAVAHDDEYGQIIASYAFRHHVKPGITGWAQVHGCRGETRGVIEMERRIDHDLWYINNWSSLLDLQILLRTIFELLRHRNAY